MNEVYKLVSLETTLYGLGQGCLSCPHKNEWSSWMTVAGQFAVMLTTVSPPHRPMFSSSVNFPTLQQRIKIELMDWIHWFFYLLLFITVCICSVILEANSFCLSLHTSFYPFGVTHLLMLSLSNESASQ